MEKDTRVEDMSQAVAGFVAGYAERLGLTNGDIMNALGLLYVTYGFAVKLDKLSNEDMSVSLVNYIDAACNAMVEALRNAEKA